MRWRRCARNWRPPARQPRDPVRRRPRRAPRPEGDRVAAVGPGDWTRDTHHAAARPRAGGEQPDHAGRRRGARQPPAENPIIDVPEEPLARRSRRRPPAGGRTAQPYQPDAYRGSHRRAQENCRGRGRAAGSARADLRPAAAASRTGAGHRLGARTAAAGIAASRNPWPPSSGHPRPTATQRLRRCAERPAAARAARQALDRRGGPTRGTAPPRAGHAAPTRAGTKRAAADRGGRPAAPAMSTARPPAPGARHRGAVEPNRPSPPQSRRPPTRRVDSTPRANRSRT